MAKMSMEQLIYITLWIIGLILILGVIFFLIDDGGDAGKEAMCRTSVISSQKVHMESLFVSFSAPTVCSPITIELEGTREEIKYQISELAAKCWWMWLEGTVVDIFKADRSETKCAICYYFSIPEDMDIGEQSNRQFFEEVKVTLRNESTIEIDELYNYMMGTTYDRKILYGGGTKQYIGDTYNFDRIRIENPQEINLNKDINSVPARHLQDFTGLIKPNTATAIEQLGQKLFEKDSLLLVVVADKIQRNDRRDARKLIETLNMNSAQNKYDAFLITIDADAGQIRMHLGGELEEYINELEIQLMLKETIGNAYDKDSLNNGLIELMNYLTEKFQDEDEYLREIEIPPKSFYAYLTNNAQNMLYLKPIETKRTYAVAYASESSILGYWKGLASANTAYLVTIGGSAIAGFFYPPTWYVTASTYGAAKASGISLEDGLESLIGRAKNDFSENSIIISRAIHLNEACKIGN